MRMELAVYSQGCWNGSVEFNRCSSKLGGWGRRGIGRSPRRNRRVGFGGVRKQHCVAVQMKGGNSEAVVDERQRLGTLRVLKGSALPFGATAREDGVNFAVYSTNAVSASLCLMSKSDLQQGKVTHEIPLEPSKHRTGDVWHAYLKGEFQDMVYGFKFDGNFSPEDGDYFDPSRIVLDPYAKAVISRDDFGVLGPEGDCWPQMAGMVPAFDDEFDWEGDLPLLNLQREMIIYELHVRGFTKHESSRTDFPGTYLGMAEKLDHLKELGVNCIELMPCHEFNELEYYNYNPASGDYK